MSIRHLETALLFVLFVAGCAPTYDPELASREMLRRDAEWSELASAGRDAERVASYWTDDARILEPGQPVIAGKAAILAYVAESFRTPGFHIHWKSEAPVVSADGTLAYLPGTAEMSVPGAGGRRMTLYMRSVTVWRREPDGIWRCVLDIANEAPPLASGEDAGHATPVSAHGGRR